MNTHTPYLLPVSPLRRGFTLIEALVSIAAMALVAAGLAAIFQSVGRTVGSGKRLSVLNQQAAMIEQTMRRDFDQMARDGILVIRQQFTATPGNPPVSMPVQTWSEDASPRPRRVDEIMFIGKGAYSSAREPLHDGYSASSEYARIYYGHGTKLPESAATYARPSISDTNRGAGTLGQSGGENEFASDWTLLRHQTLLAAPPASNNSLPPGKVFGYDPLSRPGQFLLDDKVGQIGLQPAAGSIFRSMARFTPGTTVVLPRFPKAFIRDEQGLPPPGGRPAFGSGIIDIACTDLGELRTFVIFGGNVLPQQITNASSFTGTNSTFTPGPAALDSARAWIEDAMPTPSNIGGSYSSSFESSAAGTRIRYEDEPPDYVGVLTSYTAANQAAEGAYRRGDQLMLGASNFISGCSEFIVEWSFGDTDSSTSTVLWHGLQRRVDTDGDQTPDTVVANTYPLRTNNAPQPLTYKYTLPDGDEKNYSVTPAMVYGSTFTTSNGVAETAIFGPVNPLQADGAPWAWPTMIRVTMTLADPNDPTSQATFQFVFKTPGNPR